MDVVFRRRFRVATFDVDPFGEIRPSAVMNYLQEASGLHSQLAGVSVIDLQRSGKTWVMTRYHLALERRPRTGDEVEVVTWPSGRGSKFVTRDFEVIDGDGATVALATASYAIIDVTSRKPVPIHDLVPRDYQLDRRAIDDPFHALPALGRVDREVVLPVMLRDLDVNRHVNHVVYAQWGLEAVPLTTWRDHRPASIEVGYRAETRYGDSVRSEVEVAGEPSMLHRIVNVKTGVEVARMRTTWRKAAVPGR